MSAECRFTCIFNTVVFVHLKIRLFIIHRDYTAISPLYLLYNFSQGNNATIEQLKQGFFIGAFSISITNV